MRSTYWLFGAGVVSAAAVLYVTRGGDAALTAAAVHEPRFEALPAAPAERALRAVEFLTLATGSVDAAERAALERLASAADAATLEMLAAQVAGLPAIEGRRIALEALLTRYAELDAPAAAAFAERLDLPPAAVQPLYLAWARRDARGALAALGRLPAGEALPLGVALLDVLGNDAGGIARVQGAVPHVDADDLRIEAALALAKREPAAALEMLLELPPAKARTAFERLAVPFVERDVYGAIAAAEAIGDDGLRAELRGAVLRAWARLDPETLVDYVVELDADSREASLRTGVLQAFAVVEPQRALRAAENLPGELGALLRRAALLGLASEDPFTALGIAETLPEGIERDQLLLGIALHYGQADPAAAIAWAQARATPGLLAQVALGVARADPAHAIDLAVSLPAADQARLMQTLVANSSFGPEQTAALAERLLAQAPRGRALQTLANVWAQRAPAEALPWLLAHRDSVPSSTIPQAARNLARTDPAAAIAYFERMPSELRAEWLGAVADGYAQNDARAAAAWLTQHRGERGYDAAVAAVAERSARHDPVAAARLLDSIDAARAPGAPASARAIARSWARADPAAAASWARDLPGDAAAGALAAVASEWAARDAPNARDWVMSLPPNDARDAALVQILAATAGTPAADPALFEAFSSPAARERRIGDAVRIVATRDPALAEQLAARYVTDPDLRRSTERFIVRGSSGPEIGAPAPRVR